MSEALLARLRAQSAQQVASAGAALRPEERIDSPEVQAQFDKAVAPLVEPSGSPSGRAGRF